MRSVKMNYRIRLGKVLTVCLIFRKPANGFNNAFVENKLREIVNYSGPKGFEVVLYPHSTCIFESAEEGMPLVEKINDEKLKIAFHLYHEIRAKNGHRIHEVLEAIKHKLGAVTLAGTDSVADYTNALTRDTSTIKPLGKGTFDVQKFVQQLKESSYSGDVGIMNLKFNQPPEIYLPESRNTWEAYLIKK